MVRTAHPSSAFAEDAQPALQAGLAGTDEVGGVGDAWHAGMSAYDADLATVVASVGSDPPTDDPVMADSISLLFVPEGLPLCLARSGRTPSFPDLPNEVLFEILGYLDVSDLLATSRTSHHLRELSLCPILHHYRLRRARALLPPMLASPSRPSLADLMARSIFLTRTTVVSRALARKLITIRLARRLATRPSPEALVARSVLRPECVPGRELVAPSLVARARDVERAQVRDRLRGWVGNVWRWEVRSREEGVRRREERNGVGRVWRLRRFWERVAQGETQSV